jgi:hypothetical protein
VKRKVGTLSIAIGDPGPLDLLKFGAKIASRPLAEMAVKQHIPGTILVEIATLHSACRLVLGMSEAGVAEASDAFIPTGKQRASFGKAALKPFNHSHPPGLVLVPMLRFNEG